MYIAMNRFNVNQGKEDAFEEIWSSRNSYLDTVPGFVRFNLLKGATENELTSYISHSEWETEESFLAWTKSEEFKLAHQGAKTPEGVLAGPPQFHGYRSVLSK